MTGFRPSTRLEQEYARSIASLISEQLALSTVQAHDADLLAYMLRLVAHSAVFSNAAEALATNMVNRVAVSNAKSWREAARQSTQGRRIYELLQRELAGGAQARIQEIVQGNASLIRSVPLSMAQKATAMASKASQEGLRSQAILAELRQALPKMAESRIRLIARTEVAKAASTVTQVRAQRLGAEWYIWRTAEDGRVRASHRLMDGVLCGWDDAPSPEALAREKSVGQYAPGMIWNCRCVPIPVVDLAQVNSGGSIRRVTRVQFAREYERVAA